VQGSDASPSPGTPGEGRGEGSSSSSPEPSKEGNGHGHRVTPDARPIDYDLPRVGENLEASLHSTTQTPNYPTTPTTSNLRAALADPVSQQSANLQADAPPCDVCGAITVRNGTCYKCLNCGNSMGCS
ncbi:MAG: hypothetical protein ACREJC_10970, partial [Tepidisphaeraceae bacterium]